MFEFDDRKCSQCGEDIYWDEDYAQAVFGVDEWENELDQAEKPKYELPFAKQTKEDLERLTIK